MTAAMNILPTIDAQDKHLLNFGKAVLSALPYDPSDDQMLLIAGFGHFLLYGGERSAFLLNGYAGTGKTSMTGAMVKVLSEAGTKTVLLAPTGRAAKIFADYSGHSAFTIHRKIYRQRSYGPDGTFNLAENKHRDTIFIVDEASMIANHSADGAVFGSGHLLDDLIEYVYQGQNCRLMLIGDEAQLPPVGQSLSPALNVSVVEGYGLQVYKVGLTSIARQAQESGIVHNATMLRQIMGAEKLVIPKLDVSSFPDLEALSGEFVIERIEDCYNGDGLSETAIITRSNKRAVLYNAAIRNQILYREEELSSGDILLVAKNNYFWSEEYDDVDFIANGDVVRVVRIWGEAERRYGLRFINATVEFPFRQNLEMDVKVVLDCLFSDSPALSAEQSQQLFNGVMSSLSGDKPTRLRALKKDPYYNALQVKYAYAMTCHKSQGGQWKNVFIDMGGIAPESMETLDFLRWLYTAITRATRKVYLVNYLPATEN